MTAVRGDLVAQVTGPTFVDPEILTADEWYEIIIRLSQFLTRKSLRRMSRLREIVISGDVPSGILSQVADLVLMAAFPSGLNPNTAFLICASIILRPEILPGEAKHILMSRDLNFYELRISWSVGLVTAPKKGCFYKAYKVVLEHRDLRSILYDYYKLRLGSKKDMLFGRWVLWAFSSAQRDTAENLESELSEAQRASVRLDDVYRTLAKPPVVA
jgi:hypothetical protein